MAKKNPVRVTGGLYQTNVPIGNFRASSASKPGPGDAKSRRARPRKGGKNGGGSGGH